MYYAVVLTFRVDPDQFPEIQNFYKRSVRQEYNSFTFLAIVADIDSQSKDDLRKLAREMYNKFLKKVILIFSVMLKRGRELTVCFLFLKNLLPISNTVKRDIRKQNNSSKIFARHIFMSYK